jgi:[NiFe] hydrogenase diaphorase moiety small subunit
MDAPRFHLDGQPVPFQPGQTLLQAALAAGFDIPHLCYHPELQPIGSCRLCLVQVAGRAVAACTQPAEDGQAVASAAMRKHRQALVALLLAEGRHVCVSCERTGDCRLQENAAALDAPAIAPAPPAERLVRDDSHPEVALDRGRCILCGICVQASRTLDGKNLFALAGSGADTRLEVNSPSGLLQDSAVAADDHAVRLCPVGALIRKPDLAGGMDFFADWSAF